MTSGNHMTSPGPFRDKIFYGWVVVAASTVIVCILIGIRFSFGVFFKSLESEFDLTRAATSSVFSVYMIIFAVFAVASGWALDKYGPRLVVVLMGLFTGLSLLMTSQASSLWQLYLSYSLLLAIGTSGTVPVLMSVVARWFRKKRGFALGIATSGIGLGTLIVAPLAAYLISNFGWRTSYIVLGVLAWLLVVSLALLLRRDPGEIGALPDGIKNGDSKDKLPSTEASPQQDGMPLLEAVRTRSFWLIMMANLFFALILNLTLTHVVPYATDAGISMIEASTIISVMSGIHILIRLSVGRISDAIGRKIPAIVSALFGAAALIWLIGAHNLMMFYTFALVFGFSWGGIGVILMTLPSDVFGWRSLGAITGALEIGFAIGAAIGVALGGYVFDVTGSYAMAFILAAAAILGAGLVMSLTRREYILTSGI